MTPSTEISRFLTTISGFLVCVNANSIEAISLFILGRYCLSSVSIHNIFAKSFSKSHLPHTRHNMKFTLSSLLLVAAARESLAFAPAATGSRFESATSTSLSMGLTLYGSQGSRTPLVTWGANEVGLAVTPGNLAANPHPFGQVPCLTDDADVLVFESGAILEYLYFKSDELGKDSESRKASITSWIQCACAIARDCQ
jgi:hypothetical protein